MKRKDYDDLVKAVGLIAALLTIVAAMKDIFGPKQGG
jgi:hypothetical protein